MYSEGLFDNPLTTKQEKMKNAIQALLIHSKNNPNVKLVDCNILQIYENELKKGKVKNAESGSEQEMENPTDPFKEDYSLKLPTAEHSDMSSEGVVDADIGNPKNDDIIEDKERNIESKMIEDDSEIDETELDDIEDSRGGDDIVDDNENEKHIEYQKTEIGLHLSDERSSNHQEFQTDKSSIMNLNNTQNESGGPADNNTHNSTRKDGKTCKRFTWKLQKHLTLKTSPTEKMGTMRFGGYRCVNSYVASPSYCLLQMKKTTRMTNNATYHLGKRTEYRTENSRSLENEDRYTPTDMETGIENGNNGNEVSLEEAEILTNQKRNEKTQKLSVDELPSTDSIVHNHKDRYDNAGHASSNDEFSGFKTQEAVDFKRLQDIVSLKTEEYTKKIHFLELNIIKLENQMLMEKLNKENHSSTIARLENNILRFENELLRMKQSFHHMKIDNDEMKTTQRKYLELGHSSQSQTVQNHSQEQLLSEQNQTIIRLSEKLRNQSDVITKLKNRSEYMDDQNRMLYAMVMNQTALVSQIMTKVQSLTEQTLQQREAAREMKQQIEYGLEDVKILKNSQRTQQQLDTSTTSSKHLDLEDVSNQLLQQLDDLVSDKRLESGENIKDMSVSEQPKDSVDEIDEQLKHYLHYTSVTYSVKQQEWCKSRALCYKSFIIISDCVPYSFIVFASCDVESEMNNNETRDQFESSGINFQSEEGKLLEETKDSNVQPPDPDDGTGASKEELDRTDTDKDSENKEANSNKRMRRVSEEMEVGQAPETVIDIEKTGNNVAKEKENLKYEAKDSGEIDASKASDEILDEMIKELAMKSISEKATSDRNISPEDKRNQRQVGGAHGKSKGPESTNNNSRKENNKGINTEPPKRENNTTNVKKAEIPVKYGSNGQSDPKGLYCYKICIIVSMVIVCIYSSAFYCFLFQIVMITTSKGIQEMVYIRCGLTVRTD